MSLKENADVTKSLAQLAQMLSAAREERVEDIKAILKKGFNPNADYFNGKHNALVTLIEENHLKGIRVILPFVDPTKESIKEWSPLMIAVRDHRLDVVDLLLTDDRILKHQEHLNQSLRIAAFSGHEGLVMKLLPLADPKSKSVAGAWEFEETANGWTALMAAARSGSQRCCELLWEHSDPDQISPYQNTLWEEAESLQHVALSKWIKGRIQSDHEKALLESELKSAAEVEENKGTRCELHAKGLSVRAGI